MCSINLDIPSNKISSWLISRRKLPEQWPVLLQGIERRICDNLNEEYPSDDKINKFLIDNKNNFTYIKILDLCDMLINSDESQKLNMLGAHSSSHIKKWKNVLDLYEKKNIYFGEIHNKIQRYVIFDIPNLKKNIETSQKLISDYIKKASELSKNENLAYSNYVHICSSFDIILKPSEASTSSFENNHIIFEDALFLYAKKQLPIFLNKIVRLIQENADPLIELYDAFINFNCSKTFPFLIFLKFLLKEGNASLENAKNLHFLLKEECELYARNRIAEKNKETQKEKDRNNHFIAEVDSQEIYVGIEVLDKVKNENTYTFTNKMDSNICLDANNYSSLSHFPSSDICSSSVCCKNAASEEKECMTVLMSRKFRMLLLNDLFEAKSFLMQRLKEQDNEEKAEKGRKKPLKTKENTFVFILSSLPGNLLIDNKNLNSMMKFCDTTIDILTGRKLKEVFDFKNKNIFCYSKVKELNMMRRSIERQRNDTKRLEKKILKLKNDIIEYEKALNDLRDETFKIKNFAEEKLSEILNVNVKIIGDICKI